MILIEEVNNEEEEQKKQIKDKDRERKKRWRDNNPEKCKAMYARQRNKPERQLWLKNYQPKYQYNRYHNDEEYRKMKIESVKEVYRNRNRTLNEKKSIDVEGGGGMLLQK